MKKFILTTLFGLLTMTGHAQIFNTIKRLDKFDDIILKEQIKTLVTRGDSIWSFETKGRGVKKYYLLWDDISNCVGDALVNNHEKLLQNGNIYGYQEAWVVSDILPDKLYGMSDQQFELHTFYLVHRIISLYSFEFQFYAELYWVTHNNGSRTIYCNE